MKRNIYYIYLYEVIMAIFLVIYAGISFTSLKEHETLISCSFWAVMALIIFTKLKFFKDGDYLKRYSINIVLVCILSFLIILYSLGFVTGFSRTVFSYKFLNIIKIMFPYILLIITQEYIRYTFAKNSVDNKKPIIIYTLIMIIFGLISSAYYFQFTDFESVFVFFSVKVMPTIAKEILYSYISYKCSIVPTLILRSTMDLYVFVFPFYPVISEYIESVIGVVFPFIIYVLIRRGVNYHMKGDLNTNRYKTILVLLPVIFISSVLLVLISGIFTYKLIAIGSNSMKDTYARGDAVVYKQIKDKNYESINVGDILVFNRKGVVVTHRVTKIVENNGKRIFTTKGDNNKRIDAVPVEEKDVLGIVSYKINYIGYPTIWLSEFLKREE